MSDTASAAPFLLPGLLLIAVTPHVLAESRAQLPHRHFDLAGAAAITGGMMLLVYAMTRATQVGWGAGQTLVLLIASAVLLTGFVAIELRSKAPILPLRIFGLRTLTGANVASLLLGAAMFSMFFLLTLYMQNVLGYSAIKTGVAYLTLTLSIIVFSNLGQALTTRIGARRVLPLGALLTAASLVIYANLPVHGHYFWNIFPPFLLSGIGLALAWVPAYIAGMTGVQATDAGIASGLLTTSQQIGGAIGLAAATTISITVTDHYLHSHPGTSPLSGAALTHGFQIAFYVLAALVVLAAVAAAAIVTSKPPHPVDEVDRASRMAPERLRHGGTAAELAPERST